MKSRLPSLALLAIPAVGLAACATAPSAPERPRARTALAAGDHVWNTADGNRMPYVVTGDGDVTVLLVHCWMCDRTFWSAQVSELAERYRTLAVDLPGHGQATAARTVWSVAGYGEDVAGLIEGLGLSDVVLVGHSMGGPVALRAAALARGRVRGIVAVDTLHDAEFEFSGERIEGFLRAFEADYAGTCERFVDQMLPEAGIDDVRSRVREVGCNPERSAIGIALMKSFGTIEMERWFAEAQVPIRAINAAAPNPTRIDTNRKYADFDAVTLQGVGHYLHMTRPAEFNPLLLEAISEIVGGAP
jgi:pimeloyl-ACP methyl ester carboxylesterase